ncbi:uncharacterized protein VTP21DRAFT_5475 [Calcarisporiella thermophila]|uniref:uncharacterized protein n=1 Tax=Calcarisporiella thermophila TaxID=911321 RepID=UPI0037446CC0
MAEITYKTVVAITSESLPSLDAIAKQVGDPSAGAITTFVGTTRDTFEGKRVLRLEYEAYDPMATQTLHSIIAEARTKWPVGNISIYHRTGTVPIGEASVIIAVSGVHRRETIQAVEYLIDELKRKCPIWKREVYEDGAVWKANKECC